jgi:hypothetical protein
MGLEYIFIFSISLLSLVNKLCNLDVGMPDAKQNVLMQLTVVVIKSSSVIFVLN